MSQNNVDTDYILVAGRVSGLIDNPTMPKNAAMPQHQAGQSSFAAPVACQSRR
jgi:hypothetical protein